MHISQKFGLKRHTMTHTGEKSFKSDDFDYSASRKTHLGNHTRTYTRVSHSGVIFLHFGRLISRTI